MRLKLLLLTSILLLAAGTLSAQRQREDRADISIKDRAYSPTTLRVKKGESVTWKNNDNVDHTVNAEDGSFASGTIKSGKTYKHTFKKAGRYPYSCQLHPRMKGTIVVE
jgi:plastocyanin